tara:strand:- start:101 stop:508 length:408 start_codon:yes stop_codon:yes gene_type:complete
VEVTYEWIERSSFSPNHEHANLPDHVITHFFDATPNVVKKAIEQEFIGAKLEDLESGDGLIADALIINALIGLQHDIKQDFGVSDWEGMLNAYTMDDHYYEKFHILLTMDAKGYVATEDMMTEDEFKAAMGTEFN